MCCITFGPADKPLKVFSTTHLITLIIIILICAFFMLAWRRLKTERSKKYFRYVFALFALLQQISIYIWYVYSGEWSVAVTLPLQLCDLSIFLSIFVLFTRNRYLTELLYFWGMGGATQAILTPDIGNYTFPHFVFYQFFITHCCILLACLFMVSVEKFRPSFRSVCRVFIITNIYAAVIYPVNLVTGGNYLFLRAKPPGGSLLDLLGPWPWYILSLEAAAAAIFILLYLPFAFNGTAGKAGNISIRG